MGKQRLKDTDIGVLEQRYGDEWVILAYLGPYRTNMLFMPTKVLRGGSMRVRYFDND